MTTGEAPSSPCPNCGSTRTRAFCPDCGQRAGEVIRPLWGLVAELADEALSLDGRLARTLPALFIPGRLTGEYLAGKRASYVGPVKLYLVCSVILFGSLALLGERAVGILKTDVHLGPDGPRAAEILDPLSQEARTEWTQVKEQLQIPFMTPEGSDAVEDRIEERVRGFIADPERAAPAFIEQLSRAMFVLLPLFAALLWVVKLRAYYTQHLVFALHLHSAIFLMLAAGVWLATVGRPAQGLMAAALFWGSPPFTALAARRVYPRPWLGLLVRLGVVLALYTVLVGLAMLLSVVAMLTL